MSTISERLQSVIGNRSKSEFARLCGVPESSVRQWVDGTSLPSAEKLMAIASATGISIDWLLLGKGSKNSIGHGADFGGSPAVVPVQRLHVAASAGFGAYSAGSPSTDVVDLPRRVLDRAGCKPASARILDAAGSSMEPTIGDGDLLLVDIAKERRIPVEGRIYVLSVGDALFVKRLRRSANGWMMVSDNRAHFAEEPIPADAAVTIHGQVVWTGRQLP